MVMVPSCRKIVNVIDDKLFFACVLVSVGEKYPFEGHQI